MNLETFVGCRFLTLGLVEVPFFLLVNCDALSLESAQIKRAPQVTLSFGLVVLESQ